MQPTERPCFRSASPASTISELDRLGRAALLATALLAPAASADPVKIVDPWPQACPRNVLPTPTTHLEVPTSGRALDLHYTASGLASKQIAILVNGNSYWTDHYEALAGHLAQHDFITAIALRPNNGNGGDGAYVLDVIDEILGTLAIDPNDDELAIALIGHSRGGLLTAEAVNLNLAIPDRMPIQALVALSPVTGTESWINAWEMPPYLGFYGTQDEDVDGFDNTANEAFKGYDQVGTESSTTCNSPPCVLVHPTVDKTLIQIYGADHSGLIGLDSHAKAIEAGLDTELDYLTPYDTLCLVKAYTTAFLRWKMRGENYFKCMVRDDWRPFAFSGIDNAEPDGFANPPGTAARWLFQISPEHRKVIQSFHAGDASPTHSPQVAVQHVPAGNLSAGPTFLRHHTGAVAVGWPQVGALQYVRWNVPAGSDVGSTYSHFSIRLGQVEGAPAAMSNTPGQDKTVYLGLEDIHGNTDLITLEAPYQDRYVDGSDRTRTVMTTFRVPVASIDIDFDLDNLHRVWLIFPSYTQGTVLVDSIEWHRD